jgi:hypothetical protein
MSKRNSVSIDVCACKIRADGGETVKRVCKDDPVLRTCPHRFYRTSLRHIFRIAALASLLSHKGLSGVGCLALRKIFLQIHCENLYGQVLTATR